MIPFASFLGSFWIGEKNFSKLALVIFEGFGVFAFGGLRGIFYYIQDIFESKTLTLLNEELLLNEKIT